MLITLISAKGAPGVTITAMALAAVAPGGLLVEMDPAGGDVECLLGGTGTGAGLMDVVVDLSRNASGDTIAEHAVEAPPGVRSILAPTGAAQVTAAVSTGTNLPRVLAGLDAVVVADAGRWSRAQSTVRRVAGASVVAIVVHPTVSSVEHARGVADHLGDLGIGAAVAIIVGDRPYRAEEVAAAVELPVAGTIAWDPRGANTLLTVGASRQWRRTLLARSATTTLQVLTDVAVGVPR